MSGAAGGGSVNRRQFVTALALAIPAAAAFSRDIQPRPAIRAGLIVPAGAGGSLQRGAEFGASEAMLTAALFNREFLLLTAQVEDETQAAHEAARMAEEGAVALIGGVTEPMIDVLTRSSLPLLAIYAREGAAGGADGIYRVSPTAAQYGDALARAGAADGRAVAWHHSLSRYGAGELNERFENATGQTMDEEAWFGWIAVKIVLEAALRGRDIGAARVDGHKGTLLSFDDRGVLRQPLYVVATREGKETILD